MEDTISTLNTTVIIIIIALTIRAVLIKMKENTNYYAVGETTACGHCDKRFEEGLKKQAEKAGIFICDCKCHKSNDWHKCKECFAHYRNEHKCDKFMVGLVEEHKKKKIIEKEIRINFDK